MIKPKKPFLSLHPVSINEGFTCKNCGKHNPKAKKTCRNHCRYCLYSMHVDAKAPGDRKSPCKGMMIPVYMDYKSGKGNQIIHECLKCGKKIPNKAADDDCSDAHAKIMAQQNLNHIHE